MELNPTALAAAGLALLASYALLWLLDPVAHRLGWLDRPTQPRKRHQAPTPVTGGPAIFLATLLAGVATSMPMSAAVWGLVAGGSLLLVVGLLDDVYDLRWYWRIGAQMLAALLMIYVGRVQVEQVGPMLGMQDTGLGILSVPITVIATVGLINAVNMIDGIDGLAGSLSAAFMFMLFAASLYAGNLLIANRALLLGAAVCGFLLMNLRLPWQPRARAFLGNSGSAILGFTAAWLAFRLTQNPGHPVSPVLALWLLPIPVMDTLVLVATRLKRGQSPFHADRNHIHHLMLDAGFKPTGIVLSLVAFSVFTGAIAGLLMRLDVPNVLLLLVYLLLCTWWGWLTLRRARAICFLRRLRRIGQDTSAPLGQAEIEEISPPH